MLIDGYYFCNIMCFQIQLNDDILVDHNYSVYFPETNTP